MWIISIKNSENMWEKAPLNTEKNTDRERNNPLPATVFIYWFSLSIRLKIYMENPLTVKITQTGPINTRKNRVAVLKKNTSSSNANTTNRPIVLGKYRMVICREFISVFFNVFSYLALRAKAYRNKKIPKPQARFPMCYAAIESGTLYSSLSRYTTLLVNRNSSPRGIPCLQFSRNAFTN